MVVCDTGDINLIKKLKPADATTNPTLLVKACDQPEYTYLIEDAIKVFVDVIIKYAGTKLNTYDENNKEFIELIMDKLFVNFGSEILYIKT